MLAVRALGAALAFSLALTACRTPATQVRLEIRSSCGRVEDRSVHLVVSDGAGSPVSDESIAVTAWPIERTLVPRGGDASRRWRVSITLSDASGIVMLDSQPLEGGYTAGQSDTRTITLRDPACDDAGARDAGGDAGLDAWAPADDGGEDGGSDARTPDAWGPDAGCRAGPRRSTAQLLLEYEFRRDAARPDVIAEQGTNRGLDLVGDPGVLSWGAGGLGATIGGIAGRPSVSPSALSTHIDDVSCRTPTGGLTVEAWITLPTETLPTDERAELFVFSQPGTLGRSGFTLGIDEREFIAAIDQCDGAMRPLFRFARPPRRESAVHIVYVRRGSQEHALIDGVEVPLLPPRLSSEINLGCGIELDAGAPGIVLGGREFGMGFAASPQTAHLGSLVRADGSLESGWRRAFIGAYHRLAVYCRALTDEEILENFCAGPHAP